jgi:multiple sugar transport system ATP-binding protein
VANVTLKDVTKIFAGGVRAVNHINLEVNDGEFIVLVGPSGCGKSTCLRVIAGLEEVTEGQILIDDRVVNDVPPKDRDIAMVFQNYALYPHMTAFDNMAFGLRLRRCPKNELRARVNEAADLLGITHLLNRKPKELSGGERQRVAVGRAIVRKPKVFLFDEPLSNLDAKLRIGMRAELITLHQRIGTSMIYVTHDQVEAMTMGDRIAVMKDGDVQQVASPLDLYAQPANQFVGGFIGTPPMNFLVGTVGREGPALYLDVGVFRAVIPAALAPAVAAYEGRQVILGIRPEDILCEERTGGNVIQVRVEVVEPMGSETWLYLSVGGHSLIARAGGHTCPRIGADILVRLDMEHAHFFDPETQRAIARPAGERKP